MTKHRWVPKRGRTPQSNIVQCGVCGLRRKLVVQVILSTVVRDRAKACRGVRPFALHATPGGKVWSTFQPGCDNPTRR
jgi:hypothetical protein